MLVRTKNIKPIENSYKDGKVSIYEYGGTNNQMDIAVADITGNYPQQDKYAKNTQTETMTYFVLEGKAKFYFEHGKDFDIYKGDCVFIKKGRGYKVKVKEGESLKVLMASNPAWNVDQYEIYS